MHRKFLIPGGAAPEVELSLQLAKWAKTLQVCRACMSAAHHARAEHSLNWVKSTAGLMEGQQGRSSWQKTCPLSTGLHHSGQALSTV